ncbi:MAG: hypothetical protein ABTQ73_10840 [Caldilineales bacterium]
MKTAVRYLIVLLIFCLVSLGAYELVQKNPSVANAIGIPAGMDDPGFGPDGAGFAGRGRHRPPTNLTPQQMQQFESGQPSEGFAPNGNFEGSERGGEGRIDIGRGLMGLLRNVIIIAAVTAAVIVIRWLFRRMRGPKPRPSPAGAPESQS